MMFIGGEISISYLPAELLREIFSYLSVRDLANVSCVCRHWRDVQSDPYVWKNSTFVCDNTLPLNDIVQVLDNASLLETLCIDRTRDLQAVVDKVSSTCLNIHTLIIRNMIEFCPSYFLKIGQSCCRIKILELPNTCDGPPWKRPALALSSFSNLRRLDMVHHEVLFPELRVIVDGCPYLEELYIPQAFLYNSDVEYLIEQRKQTLRGLFISALSLTENCLCKLGELQSLRALTISNCEVSMRVAEHIRNLDLVSLGLPCVSGLTSDVMCSLLSVENMRNLRLINVAGCPLLGESFARSLPLYCPSVEHLNLSCCTGITERGLGLIIEGCSKLETLNILGLSCETGNILDNIPKCLKALKLLRVEEIFHGEQRGSRLRKFVDAVRTVLPELKVKGSGTRVENKFTECNKDLYHVWSNL